MPFKSQLDILVVGASGIQKDAIGPPLYRRKPRRTRPLTDTD